MSEYSSLLAISSSTHDAIEVLLVDVLCDPLETLQVDRATTSLPIQIINFGGGFQTWPVFRVSVFASMIMTVVTLQLTLPVGVPLTRDTMQPANESSIPVSMHSAAFTELSSSGAVETASLAVASGGNVLALPATSSSALLPFPFASQQVGVFLTASSVKNTNFFTSTMDDLLASSGSALVFDVKGGSVLFHSAAPMALKSGLVRPLYELPAIVALARSRGIYTIGRFVAIKDGGLTRALPETRIMHPVTKKVLSTDWIDPSNATAIAYNTEVICELAQSGIDEINLDYIRFSTAEFGALGVFSSEEKADKVETFIRAAREAIDRCGPSTKLGLSTYAILGWNYEANVRTLGQDVARFAPLVDIISPMAYPATFAVGHYYRPGVDPRSRMYFLVHRTLTGYQSFLGPEHAKKLRPWIQGYGVTSRNMLDQIDAVYDAGICGYTVWNADNAYAPTYTAMKASGHRPDHCL